MSYPIPRDPCRVGGSDDDEKGNQLRAPITTRSTTSKFATKPLPPRTHEWDPSLNIPNLNEIQSFHKKLNPTNGNERLETQQSRISSSSSSDSSARLNKPHEPIISPESPPTSPATANASNFDPIPLIQANLSKFIYTYVPKEYSPFVQCCLRRDKNGVQGGFLPTFYLHAERPGDGKKFFLLAARKVAKVKRQSEYLITTNVETLSEKSGGDGYVGRLRGNNVSGTEYTLFDNGLSPNKRANTRLINSEENLRRELVGIVYNTNILGFKGPRQMSAVIPQLGHDIRPTKSEHSILEQWRDRRFSYIMLLRNKVPTFNEETKTYVLRFTGNRVAQPSVKNFQIVIENENHEEEVAMQFGRVDEDVFTCDYRYPLSALQAFGIALSSFDSRLARE